MFVFSTGDHGKVYKNHLKMNWVKKHCWITRICVKTDVPLGENEARASDHEAARGSKAVRRLGEHPEGRCGPVGCGARSHPQRLAQEPRETTGRGASSRGKDAAGQRHATEGRGCAPPTRTLGPRAQKGTAQPGGGAPSSSPRRRSQPSPANPGTRDLMRQHGLSQCDKDLEMETPS